MVVRKSVFFIFFRNFTLKIKNINFFSDFPGDENRVLVEDSDLRVPPGGNQVDGLPPV